MTYTLIPHGRLIEQHGATTRCYWQDDPVDYRGGKVRAGDFVLAGGEPGIKLDEALRYTWHSELAWRLRQADKRCADADTIVRYLTRDVEVESGLLFDQLLAEPEPIDGVSREAYDVAVWAKDEAERDRDRLMRDEIAPILDAAGRRLEAGADPLYLGDWI